MHVFFFFYEGEFLNYYNCALGGSSPLVYTANLVTCFLLKICMQQIGYISFFALGNVFFGICYLNT